MSDPYRIRRSSKKEFSRVSSLLRSQVEKLEKRVALLEAKLGLEEKPAPKKRRRAKKAVEETTEE
jgi:BMFP domain-containing protein YqiC